MDTAVLTLYHLQAYYWNDWQQGLAGIHLCYWVKLVLCICIHIGLGEYKLTEEFVSAKIPSDEVHLIPALSMDDIVKSVREGIDIHVHSEAGVYIQKCIGAGLIKVIKHVYLDFSENGPSSW